ncbi:MAG: response regulator transcription factor [Paludibacteraceae bacterium]|nr:response regulator transcription factor [Paludibacteraceae bacterium]
MKAEDIIIADKQALTAYGAELMIGSLPEYAEKQPRFFHASGKNELIAFLREERETAVILDFTLFDLESAEQLILLVEKHRNSTFLLLSDELTPDFLRFVLYSSDRIGVVYKDAPADILREAFKYTIQGKRYISQHATEILLRNSIEKERRQDDLTQTEREVLKLIAQGKTTKEIAAERFSSIHTINSHRKNIFRKLNINSAHDATKYALRAGLIDESEFYI